MIYMVATPIGNLGDLSQRAKELFIKSDLILAEDTRQTQKILNYLGLKKRIVSFHVKSGKNKLDRLSEQIISSKVVLYCSDAGAPNLSDPGSSVVQWAIENNIYFSPVPGPSSLTALISVCPFPINEFIFKGYFPKKKGRKTLLEQLRNEKLPVFFFESPHRIEKTLSLINENLANKNIIIGRELTKKFEQIIISKVEDLKCNEIINKGEFVFCLY